MKDAVARVFTMFFFLGKTARRTKAFALLSFLPVVISLVFKFEQIFKGESSIEVLSVFSNLNMLFDLQFLILILSLFYGTSVCSEDLEAKTLPYLVTRPVSKSAIVLGKYLAYTLLAIVMVDLGMIFSFLILNIEHIFNFWLVKVLLRDLGVLTLGILTYSAFFTFLGSFLKRAIFVGLIFSFGWENVIQYFPGSTQRFAIVHYLKSFLPYSSSRFSILTFRLEPTPPLLSFLALALMTAVFLALACLLFSQKEYISED